MKRKQTLPSIEYTRLPEVNDSRYWLTLYHVDSSISNQRTAIKMLTEKHYEVIEESKTC